jgi:hypothetical protein
MDPIVEDARVQAIGRLTPEIGEGYATIVANMLLSDRELRSHVETIVELSPRP